MQTADWALVISICSAAISLAGFIWNVWSKFIYPKPRVRVHFSMVTAFYPRAPRDPDPVRVLSLSATNMGPAEVTLRSALILFKRHWFSEGTHGILNVLPRLPGSTDYEFEYDALRWSFRWLSEEAGCGGVLQRLSDTRPRNVGSRRLLPHRV